MVVKVITAPPNTPITTAEFKSHANIAHTDDDTLIGIYIKAATENLIGPHGWLGRSLVQQTLELVLDIFPANAIFLPHGPVISVTSVKYDDTDGNEQTVSSSDYTVDNNASGFGWIVPADDVAWPDTIDAINAVRVRYVAGYEPLSGDYTANIPDPIRAAVMMMVADIYQQRENFSAENLTRVPMTMGARTLLAPWRVTWFG